jgi:alpha-methylacyl-CoA racemase
MPGPLHGLTIVEFAGIGPAPFAAMMLADHGADVIRIERQGMIGFDGDPLNRSRRSISLDLKMAEGCKVAFDLASRADGLIEGYRPGVMERLGLGPDALLSANPKLVYGRVTGWSRDSELAGSAGHDVNYLAMTGLLHAMGEPGRPPVPPLNLVADYAGGGMMLAFGMVAALLDVQRGGAGQIVDTAMTHGAALIGALIYGLRGAGQWSDERGANLLNGGDPLYRCYECADRKYVALGAIEPQFRTALLERLGLDAGAGADAVAAVLATRSRDEWIAHFEGAEACVAPVLSLAEAPQHPANAGIFIDLDGVIQPAPSPLYSRTATAPPRPPRERGADGDALLRELGYDSGEIARLRDQGVVL